MPEGGREGTPLPPSLSPAEQAIADLIHRKKNSGWTLWKTSQQCGQLAPWRGLPRTLGFLWGQGDVPWTLLWEPGMAAGS